jgi:hypothetical protein
MKRGGRHGDGNVNKLCIRGVPQPKTASFLRPEVDFIARATPKFAIDCKPHQGSRVRGFLSRIPIAGRRPGLGLATTYDDAAGAGRGIVVSKALRIPWDHFCVRSVLRSNTLAVSLSLKATIIKIVADKRTNPPKILASRRAMIMITQLS